MARDKDIFNCDISLFNINPATQVTLADAVTYSNYTAFIGAFTNCRFNGEVEIANSDAAHDIESDNLGIGKKLSIYRRWSAELGAVVDGSLDPALFLEVAFLGPTGGTGTDQQKFKHVGRVGVVIQRRGGSGVIEYNGEGWFLAAEVSVNEGAMNQSGTIDGFGPLHYTTH